MQANAAGWQYPLAMVVSELSRELNMLSGAVLQGVGKVDSKRVMEKMLLVRGRNRREGN